MSIAAWDIYAEQLVSLGYGYPLWYPDPSPERAPVQLGDVGWVKEGEFHALFNALREAHDAQPMGAVPADFAPLNPLGGVQIVGPRQKIWQRVLHSETIHCTDVSGGVAVNGPAPSAVSGGVNFTFNCSGNSGALLILNPCGMGHDILSTGAVKDYIDANFDRWLSFANHTMGLDLREDDIRFVTGTTKTSQWALAAFRGSYKHKQGAFTGNLAGVGAASFSMSISDQALPVNFYRVGPPELEHAHFSDSQRIASESSSSHAETRYDQCIFFNSSKRKTRLDKRLEKLLRFLKAGAGPHDLPRRPDDTTFGAQLLTAAAADTEFEAEDLAHLQEVLLQTDPADCAAELACFKDPVEALLDYILDNSNARTAIASDIDLYELLSSENVEWPHPQDLKSVLEKMNATVRVSPSGVGSIHIERDSRALEAVHTAITPEIVAQPLMFPAEDVPLREDEPKPHAWEGFIDTAEGDSDKAQASPNPASYRARAPLAPPWTRNMRPTIVASQPYNVKRMVDYTDDANTKLSDRVRRKCYNCRTTDTSTWRRSILNPSKVLCNQCGLFERTHSRPRPEQFAPKRGLIASVVERAPFIQPRVPTSPSRPGQKQQQQQLPSLAPQMLPSHPNSYPSLLPLTATAAADPTQYRSSGDIESSALLSGPCESQASGTAGPSFCVPFTLGSPSQAHQQ
ncbi:hypothetical protein VTO73DRAFT_4525 [Trametes versicolor]